VQALKKILKNQKFFSDFLASDNQQQHYIYITRPRGVFKFGILQTKLKKYEYFRIWRFFEKNLHSISHTNILGWIFLLHHTKDVAEIWHVLQLGGPVIF
jgi:hypothetical protein